MTELRPYQQKSIFALRSEILNGKTRLILCAPTGSGKTIMFSFMLQSALAKNKKCMVLTHRTELLTQAGGVLNNLNCGVVNLDAKLKTVPKNALMYVAMTQTLIRRVKNKEYLDIINDLDLLIIDESHLQNFNSIQKHVQDKTIVIGATATPFRYGNQDSLHLFYQTIVEEIRIKELINLGFLATPRSFGIEVDLNGVITKGLDYDAESLGAFYNENKLYDGVYENYTRLTPNKKAIIFAPNIASSVMLVQQFKAKGLPIQHLDGNTPEQERKAILNWFETTPNALISNVGILTAGYDCPDIDVVILYRATKSLSLFLQMVGRGSRTTATKKEFTILDFGNNIHRFGFWENDRDWALHKKRKREGTAPVKDCPECNAILPASVMLCQYCGYVFEKSQKEVEADLIVELQQLTPQQLKKETLVADFRKLELIALAKGYKGGWIFHQLKTISDIQEYAKYKGYSGKWVNYQINAKRN